MKQAPRIFQNRLVKLLTLYALVLALCIGANAVWVRIPKALPQATAMQVPAEPARSKYSAQLEYDEAKHAVVGTETIEFYNPSEETLRELLLNVYPNAYQSQAGAPVEATLFDLTYPSGFSEGGIRFESVKSNGKSTEYRFDGTQATRLFVTLDAPLVPGMYATIELAFTLQLPNAGGRFGWTDTDVRLTNALPIAARIDAEGWYEDDVPIVGEFVNADIGDWDVTLTVPEGYVVAASGLTQSAAAQDGKTTYRCSAPLSREWGCVFSKKYQVMGEKRGDTVVFVYTLTRNSGKKVLEYAKASLAAYEELFGAYPYPTYSVAAGSVPMDALRCAGLTLLDHDFYQPDAADSLEMLLAQQTAHQWWYNMLGNDMIRDPWMQESLAAYSALRYYRLTQGESYERYAYDTYLYSLSEHTPDVDSLAIGQPSSAFSDWQTYWALLMGRGSEMWYELETDMGFSDTDALLKGLRAYFEEYRYRNARPEDLIASLQKYTDLDMTHLFETWLELPDPDVVQ